MLIELEGYEKIVGSLVSHNNVCAVILTGDPGKTSAKLREIRSLHCACGFCLDYFHKECYYLVIKSEQVLMEIEKRSDFVPV